MRSYQEPYYNWRKILSFVLAGFMCTALFVGALLLFGPGAIPLFETGGNYTVFAVLSIAAAALNYLDNFPRIYKRIPNDIDGNALGDLVDRNWGALVIGGGLVMALAFAALFTALTGGLGVPLMLKVLAFGFSVGATVIPYFCKGINLLCRGAQWLASKIWQCCYGKSTEVKPSDTCTPSDHLKSTNGNEIKLDAAQPQKADKGLGNVVADVPLEDRWITRYKEATSNTQRPVAPPNPSTASAAPAKVVVPHGSLVTTPGINSPIHPSTTGATPAASADQKPTVTVTPSVP